MAEITKVEPMDGRFGSRITLVTLGALTLLAYFLGLNLPLLGPDEPRYAQVAREMFERGDWVTPTLGGHHWFEKPALLYWLEIVAYKAFGVSEFSARLGPALFGLGTIAALWLLGKKFATEHTDSTQTSPGSLFSMANFRDLLAVIAASTVGIIAFSHGASFDIILTFPLTASLVCFYYFDRAEMGKSGTLVLIGFYAFIGVGLLAKGLIGIVFPFAIVGFYYLLSRRMPSVRFIVSLLWGTLIAVAVAAVWYWPMYARHGYEFIDEFIIQHHFQRFTSNKYQHPQPFYFFLWMLPVLSIPWFPFAFASVWKAARALFRPNAQGDQVGQVSSLLRFSLSWLIVPLVFFSFSGSKLPGYIMPSVPAMVILAGLAVREFARSRFRLTLVNAIAAGTLLVVIGLLTGYMPTFAKSDSIRSLTDAARERGLGDRKVACLHNISHNAEFYAARRLIRDEEGKIRRFSMTLELADYLKDTMTPDALVLVPPQYVAELAAESKLDTDVVADNGELMLVYAKLKDLPVGSTPQPIH